VNNAYAPVAAPRALPEGTVTFLFTDVQGSTQLLERYPETYRAAILRHDALLRAAVRDHGGEVFKTVGDAVCAAFARPSDALAAAVEAQQGLQGELWPGIGALKVRMGLHTGAVERDGGDYFGATLHRCARLVATAHGGQVVLSAATAGLVLDVLPAGVTLLDLGEHRLRDLQRPERIFQLLHPALWRDFPPLRSQTAALTNLPAPATPFVGREGVAERLCQMLRRDDVRLLTLVGPGGSGKTRLALHVAAEVVDAFEHGVFFVPLAAVDAPELIVPAVAHALGLTGAGGDLSPDTLANTLRERRLLLVLDNFEQVMDGASPVADLLVRCPLLKALVTSRAVLRVYGEHVVEVPPMALPDLRRLPPLARLAECESGSSRRGRCWSGSSGGCRCSPAGRAPCRRGSRRSTRPSRGATTCWTPPNRRCSGAWRYSPAAARWRRRRRYVGQ
jgi:class 3 adenylate cyclase